MLFVGGWEIGQACAARYLRVVVAGVVVVVPKVAYIFECKSGLVPGDFLSRKTKHVFRFL